MLLFYRIIRTALYALLVLLAGSVLFFENIRGPRTIAQIASGNASNVTNPVMPALSFYESLRGAVLYDPYDAGVISKVRSSSEEFKKKIHLIANSVSDLITNADFYNNVFIFMVSKKADGIGGLIDRVFTNIPAFTDLVILDKDRDVVYKHGSASFTADNFDTTNERAVICLDREIAVLGRYRDATLDSEFRIIALFNAESIAAGLREFPYPAFLIISNRMYRNSGILPDIIRNIQQNLNDEREYFTGLTVVQTFTISAQHARFGTLGVAYPARNIVSVILILLKVSLLVLLVLGWIALDRALRKNIKKAEVRIKERQAIIPRTNPKKKEVTPEQEDAETDMRLDWIQDYVSDQDKPEEKEKKGEKK